MLRANERLVLINCPHKVRASQKRLYAVLLRKPRKKLIATPMMVNGVGVRE